jgi:hypothetical protein
MRLTEAHLGVQGTENRRRPNESRISCVVRRAAIKRDPFSFKRPPRHDSFMRWLAGARLILSSNGSPA